MRGEQGLLICRQIAPQPLKLHLGATVMLVDNNTHLALYSAVVDQNSSNQATGIG
jgi:hypothetical protein